MTTLSMHHVIRTSLRATLCLLCVLGIVITPAQAQANLIAYFPLDGDPAPGQFYAPGGEPQTVPGKIGEALQCDGGAVIALPLDLGQYHQLTFTAWGKITDPELNSGKLVSTGKQPGPEIYLRGDFVFHAGRRALDTNVEMPVGEWTFVAGVADFSASEARVHQGDFTETSSGVIETDLSQLQPSFYEDPNDPQADRQRFIFIGARDFRLNLAPANPARGIAIDDVRIYSEALSQDEIEAMRTNPEPLAIGPYPPPPQDNEEDEDPGVGGGGDADNDGDNDSTGGNDGDNDTSGSGDGQDGDEDDGDGGDLKLIGVRLDDEFHISRISGDTAEHTRTVDLQTAPLQKLNIIANKYGIVGTEIKPCRAFLFSFASGNPFSFEKTERIGRGVTFENCGIDGREGGFGRWLEVEFEDGYYIQSLRVCQNRRQNNRITGLQASAVRVVVNEYTNEIDFRDVATASESSPQCKDLRQTIRCGDDEVASGIRVRYDQRGAVASFTGLELVCREVIPRYEN